MRNTILLLSFITFLTGCGSSTEQTSSNDSSSVVTGITPSDSVLCFQAVLDGAEDELYIFSANNEKITDSIKEVHIVPEINPAGMYNDSSEQYDYMLSIIATGFSLYYSHFEGFNGKIRVFYDANRTSLVTEFDLIGQNANGPVNVFSPEGEMVISRQYENGTCVSSVLDLYAIDWTFKPSTAELNLEKFAAYKKTDANGNTIISLGESMHPNADLFKNDLYELIQKPVFENNFKVNGEVFTGTLMGYYTASDLTPDTYFELPFVDGKLHDTIRLYGYYGDLELEERFENGVLVETIYEMDYSEMDGMAKPVLYLYPESEMNIHVELDLKGKITHSYPTYPTDGWNVKALPDGTLYDQKGQEFYALFWEGISEQNFTYKNGFVVPGNETAAFLENSLSILGLNRREANEFIMYWLPQMENNAFNLIHFSTDEYEEIAALKITPKPESLIRVMMVWSPLDNKIEIPQQNLYDLKVVRKGFTAVEWGGKKQPVNSAL